MKKNFKYYLETTNSNTEKEDKNLDNAYSKLYKFAEAFGKDDILIGKEANSDNLFISIKSGKNEKGNDEFFDFVFSDDIYRDSIDKMRFKIFKNGTEIK